MSGTEQVITAALRSVAEEVVMSPEQVEQRYADLLERAEVPAGRARTRRRVVTVAAGLGAAAAVAVGVALAGWPGADRTAPAPATTQDVSEGDAAAVVTLYGGEALEPGARYAAVPVDGVAFDATLPAAVGEAEMTYDSEPGWAGLGNDDVWFLVGALDGVYDPAGTWVGQRSLLPPPEDPQAYFAYLADLGLDVGTTEPGDVGGVPALVADVEAPATLPADRVGCPPADEDRQTGGGALEPAPAELIPCVAIAPVRPQALGLAGTHQHGLWAGDVTRQWALELDGRLVVVLAGSTPEAGPQLAGQLGDEFAASLTWR